MTWKPLLTEENSASALRVVREVAGVLADPPLCWVPPGARDEYIRVANATLGGGRAGIALLFGYLARLDPSESSYRAAARNLITQSVRATQSEVMGPSLFGGFAGVGWALRKLSEWDIVACDESAFDAIDDALATYLDRQPWPLHIDLITGMTGIAVYALDRLPHPTAEHCLQLVVRNFVSCAEETPEGITWFTRPELLQAESLRSAPHGYYNLGIAHGVPGILSVLARTAAAGIETDRAARLVDGAVRWLLALQLENGNFPYMTGREVNVRPSRLAWCYGAPGIAAVLHDAGTLLDRAEWRQAAVRIGEWAAALPADQSGVEDAGICHGAAGLAHMFNRLHQATGNALFADAARRWFAHALAYRRDGQGVAGFRAWNPDPTAPEPYLDEPGLLAGTAGIAASLAAACADIDPEWDRMFLMSA